MKSIDLTGYGGIVQGTVLVDDEDFNEVSKFKWWLHGKYAARSVKLSEKHLISTRSVLMHRLLMNTPKGMDTDHINGNKLDNRRSNLRVCNRAENKRNTPRHIDNQTGFKGVTTNKYSKKNPFIAAITLNGKRIYIGCFANAEDAAKAYDEAAIKHFGIFAQTNFDYVMEGKA